MDRQPRQQRHVRLQREHGRKPAAGTPASWGGATIPTTFALLDDGGFLARGTFGTGVIPASNIGTRMMWHPRKAAFRAGQVTIPAWDDVNIGTHSAAFGLNTVASGIYSFAAGVDSAALGTASTAFGSNAQATANYSAAIGTNAIAAVRSRSRPARKPGPPATARPRWVSMPKQRPRTPARSCSATRPRWRSEPGCSPRGPTSSWPGPLAASISSRFPHDTRRLPGLPGVRLTSNSSAWISVSDVNAKENFRDIAPEDVLARVAAMPVREWNYKAQGADIRHIGPTAQDFRAAFGLGEDPLGISTIDADGVALAAVRALEARTRETNERLTRENDELRARLARLEARSTSSELADDPPPLRYGPRRRR